MLPISFFSFIVILPIINQSFLSSETVIPSDLWELLNVFFATFIIIKSQCHLCQNQLNFIQFRKILNLYANIHYF
jgi:hypothetical protein